MNKFILTALVWSCATLVFASEAVEWGYAENNAPEHWGALSPDYKTCDSGTQQSPINITQAIERKAKQKIAIHYKVSPHDVVFNGHTVQVNTIDKDDYVILDQQKYFLQQFHFHTPSENQIHSKSFPLELHFVNANAQGKLSVLSVMFVLGRENTEWNKFWADLSNKENDDKVLSRPINLDKLLPKQRDYYRTMGSLTTPPCTEGVNWIIFEQPITISNTQLNELKTLLHHHANNRPVQPTNGRLVIED